MPTFHDSAPEPQNANPCRPASRQLRRNATLLGLCLLMLGVLACEKREEAPKAGLPEVLVAEVLQQNVPIFGEWVAQLNGPVNAEITPKVQGYLLRQNYQNGFFVKKGELMFELDPRQYQAAVDQAKAQVAVAQAKLAEATTNVDRDTPLAAQNAIPQKQLDTDLANQAAFKAEVLAQQAALQNAELNLAWTKIYAPIDGIAGVSTSQIGDLVGTSTKMTTVSQVHPIWAYFNISESAFLGAAGKIQGIISGKNSMDQTPVEFIQANDVPFPQKGKFVYVNRQVGTQTGTIQVAAEFPNPDASLRPGGFGRVRLQTGYNKNALLVPQPAVIEIQGQYQLIVLNDQNKATFRPVKMGERVGTSWIVTEGLKPGEKVVVEGVQKVQQFAAAVPEMAKEGVPVVAKPYVPPAQTAGSN
ncbi:MAG: efflux RND transporter periplasmic adaptor subunit [Acidobacteriota bacterium]|nr:efflux RND transporter periplasmic adaptor subunit [Acidobacteriota bacterium]